MKVTVDRLRNALDWVTPVIPKTSTLAALQYARVGEGAVVGNNLEQIIRVDLPEADEVLMAPPKLVLAFLKTIPGGEMLTITRNKQGALEIEAPGGLTAEFNNIKPSEYPDLPPAVKGEEANVDGDALMDGMNAVLPYTAGEESRPVLCAVCLRGGDPASVAGADGFRLAVKEMPFAFDAAGQDYIIPNSTVALLGKIWAKTPRVISSKPTFIQTLLSKRDMRLNYTKSQMDITFGTIRFSTVLIQGTYPDYDRLFPTVRYEMKFLGRDLLLAVDRVKNIANAASGIVRLKWREPDTDANNLRVYAQAEEVGRMSCNVSLLEAPPEPGHIAINCEFLRSYLAGRPEVITAGYSTDSSPLFMTHSNSPKVLIMPQFVQW